MKRVLLSLLRVSSLLMLSALLAGGEQGAAVFGALAAFFPVGLMALGACRGSRLKRSGVALLALAAVLQGGFWLLLALRGSVPTAPWVLGLPAATAALLAFVWLLPLVLVSLTYAWTFEEHGVSEEGLERLRRAAGERAAGEGGG